MSDEVGELLNEFLSLCLKQRKEQFIDSPHVNIREYLKTSALDLAQKLYTKAAELERSGDISQAIELYNRAYKLDPEIDKHIDHEKLASEISKKDLSDIESFYNPFRKFMTNCPVDPELKTLIFKSSKAALTSGKLTKEDNPNVFRLSMPTRELDLLSQLPEDLLENVLVYLGEINLGSLETASNASRSLYLACRQESLWRRLLHGRSCSIISEQTQDSWRLWFIMHPHFRTDGIYISKITYFRQGYQESAISQPSQLVTYYRYLRFIGGGLVMSLVTTEKPKGAIEQLRSVDLNILKSIKSRFNTINKPQTSASQAKPSQLNNTFNTNHITIGFYRQRPKSANSFKLILFDPQPKYPMRLRMIMELPDDGTGPSYRWTKCLQYTGRVYSMTGPERINFDTHNWGKFFFSRVKSYIT